MDLRGGFNLDGGSLANYLVSCSLAVSHLSCLSPSAQPAGIACVLLVGNSTCIAFGEGRSCQQPVHFCAGFWTPGCRHDPRGVAAGVQKAPRHEIAGRMRERYGTVCFLIVSGKSGGRLPAGRSSLSPHLRSAVGAKRTLSGRQNRLNWSKMTHIRRLVADHAKNGWGAPF
jgi:hypothetical protein